MGSNICMNGLCGVTTSPEWKRGWATKSGGYATLCYNCGTAYENVVYCERFHLNESGWRECKFCEKPIHCGCIVSKYLHDYLDFGGIACIICLRAMANRSLRPLQSSSDDIRNGFGTVTPMSSWQSAAVGSRISGISADKGKLAQLSEAVEKHQLFPSTPSHKVDPTLSIGQVKRENIVLTAGEVGTGFSSTEVRSVFPHATQKSNPSSMFAKPDNSRPTLGLKDMYESLAQASLNFSLGGPQGTSNSGMSNPGGVVESSEPDKVPPFKQGQRTRHILPKPPKPGLSAQSPQANKGAPQQTRVARPPAEGRGRNQLLPRYWPKITDQELEQISGEYP